MLRRGVELEDMRLLQESFSPEDELVFLQAANAKTAEDRKPTVHQRSLLGDDPTEKAMENFSGLKSGKAPRVAANPSQADFDKLLGEKVGGTVSEGTKMSTNAILKMALKKQKPETESSKKQDEEAGTSQTKEPIETKGIDKILAAAKKKATKQQEKQSVQDLGDLTAQCIRFCQDLATKAANVAKELAGKREKAQLLAEAKSEQKIVKHDQQQLASKEQLVVEDKKDKEKAKVRDAEDKEKDLEEEGSNEKEEVNSADQMRNIAIGALNRETKKLKKNLDQLQAKTEQKHKAKAAADETKAKEEKKRQDKLVQLKAENEAVTSKEKTAQEKVHNSEKLNKNLVSQIEKIQGASDKAQQ